MQFLTDLADVPSLAGCVVTAGTFDGVHLGHQRILGLVRERASALGVPAVVVTYWPHPRLVLFPEQVDLKILSTQAEKCDLIAKIGIDALVQIPFTHAFAALTYTEYIDQIIKGALNASTFVLGHDHAFGSGREGSFERLIDLAAARGLALAQVPVHLVEDAAVSSSKIRHALVDGQPEAAARLLGRPYSFAGLVVHGRKLGRTIGYPTANLELDEPAKLLPAAGVYAAEAELWDGTRRGAMINIGTNPTIPGKGFSIEAHLFDYVGDLYDKPLRLHCLARLRDEVKFDGLTALTAALADDARRATEILANH